MFNPDAFGSINNAFLIKGQPVFNFEGNLYTCDNEFNNWRYYFSDTSLYNRYGKTYFGLYIWLYFNIKNDLFVPYYEHDTTKRIKGDPFQNNQPLIYKFGIHKFDTLTNRFEPYNNLFCDNYYASKYHPSDEQSSIGILFRASNTVFQDSIIVKAGSCKSIVQSRDSCKTWELISNLSGTPKIILNDSTYFYIDNKPFHNDINRTTDYGVTFHPTEFGLDTVNARIIKSNGSSKYDTTYRLMCITYFNLYNEPKLFYIDESGKGFFAGSTDNEYLDLPNFAFTLDGGKHFKFKYFKNFIFQFGDRVYPRFSSNVVKIDDKYLFAMSSLYPYFIRDTSNYTIFMLDTNFETFSTIQYENKLSMIHYFLADDLQSYMVFMTTQDKDNLFNLSFEIQKTQDS